MRTGLSCLSLLVGVWFSSLIPLAAEEADGFKVIRFENEATYKAADGMKPVAINQVLPFGTTVKTGLRSTLDLELSPGNQFRVMPRATIILSRDTKDGQLKILKLEHGTVEIKLDKMPAGHKLQVETPTAVYGALGTRFVVSFEDDPNAEDIRAKKDSRETRLACDKGQIYAASHFTIKDAVTDAKTVNIPAIKEGSALLAVIHEGLENTYTDFTVNRGTVSFTFGVDQGAILSAKADDHGPARFVCALEKSDRNVAGAAVEVKSGTVRHTLTKKARIGKDEVNTELRADDGAILIRQGAVLYSEPGASIKDEKGGDQADMNVKPGDRQPNAVHAYLAAAKTEGELHSKVVSIRLAGNTVPAADEDALKQAAANATTLRRELFSDRVIKLLQQIRHGAQRASQLR